jgi:hypothetical protein
MCPLLHASVTDISYGISRGCPGLQSPGRNGLQRPSAARGMNAPDPLPIGDVTEEASEPHCSILADSHGTGGRGQATLQRQSRSWSPRMPLPREAQDFSPFSDCPYLFASHPSVTGVALNTTESQLASDSTDSKRSGDVMLRNRMDLFRTIGHCLDGVHGESPP